MKTIRNLFAVITIYAVLFISCKQAQSNQEQTVPSKQDTVAVETEVATQEVLKDTIGIYKLSNAEAQSYVLKMTKIIHDVEKAMDDNTPDRMPELLNELRENQSVQVKIQSVLSKTDLALFKVYMDSVAKRLIELGNKMNNM